MTQKTTRKKPARNGDAPRSVGGYKVLGRTSDGVRILKPKGKPQSFTVMELKKAIRSVRAEKTA
jgi:hypothetical protein